MSAPQTIAILNARLADGDRLVEGGLRLRGGVIAEIGAIAPEGDEQIIDAKGLIAAPGIVDLGVFALDRESFRMGGITACALMPDQDPVLDLPSRVAHIAAMGAAEASRCEGYCPRIYPIAAASRNLEGRELAEIALMKQAGARAVATGRRWIADSAVMMRVMQYAAMLDFTVISHAEDGALTRGAVASAGEMATRLGLPSAPAQAEAIAVARDLALAEITGARLHFRQLTTRGALELLRAARQRGLPVSAGVTPAHFLLNELAIGDFRSFARLSPPLRCEDDRQAVIEAIADGTIEVIGSGHDPRGPEEKRLPFADAAEGMAGAQTLLALSLTLVRDGVIGYARLFEMLAANPARLLGLESGRLERGLSADVMLIDPDAPWIVNRLDGAVAGADNTPFDGQGVSGRVRQLFLGGALVSG